jgi:hypothetical protein
MKGGSQHSLDMLRHSKLLLEKRQHTTNKRSIHFPRIKFRKWLFTGSEEHTLPPASKDAFQSAEGPRAEQRTGRRKSAPARRFISRLKGKWYGIRKGAGEFLEWASESDEFLYASKFTFGVMLVSWPAFVQSWTQWYNLSRGGE